MSVSAIKFRLIVLNFLEFAVWGAYLVSMGNYLGNAGMGTLIAWFYAIQGIVSIFMPALMGIVADKLMQPQRVLAMCQALAGAAMLGCWGLGMASPEPSTTAFITLYTVSVAFFMPTIALANTVAFRILNDHKLDPVTAFPPIRVFGTVGFIITMWFVNCAFVEPGRGFGFSLDSIYRFQYTQWQFFVSAVLSLVMAVYCLTLPQCPLVKDTSAKKKGIAEALGLNAFALFKKKELALFFIFSMLLGMCLQVTNGYATPYITSFSSMTEFAESFGAQNATLLTSISQMSEALCILLIPFFLKRFGIKIVMFISFVAWVLRFGFFGLGNPGSGVWMFIISMLVYGVAFDFFNVSGAIFIEREAPGDIQASAQGLFMLMTNGLGATIGTLSAGAVVNHFCSWQQMGDSSYLVGNWPVVWYIFAGFAAVVGLLFLLLFKGSSQHPSINLAKATDKGDNEPAGYTGGAK